MLLCSAISLLERIESHLSLARVEQVRELPQLHCSYRTNANRRESGAHELTLIVPCPPKK